MSRGEDFVRVEWPSLDVRELQETSARVRDAVEKLWAAGRLRNLLESPEGFRALESYQQARSRVRQQWLDAQERGAEQTPLSVEFPAALSRSLLAFLRQLYEMLADEETMRAVGGAPLPPDDFEGLAIFIEALERAIATHTGRFEAV